MLDLVFIRSLFVIIVSACAFHFKPLGASAPLAATGGAVIALAIIFLEMRLKKVSLPRLIGAVLGGATGVLGGFLMSAVLVHVNPDNSTTCTLFNSDW